MSSKPRPELCWHIAEVRNIAINFAQVESPGIKQELGSTEFLG